MKSSPACIQDRGRFMNVRYRDTSFAVSMTPSVDRMAVTLFIAGKFALGAKSVMHLWAV